MAAASRDIDGEVAVADDDADGAAALDAERAVLELAGQRRSEAARAGLAAERVGDDGIAVPAPGVIDVSAIQIRRMPSMVRPTSSGGRAATAAAIARDIVDGEEPVR